MNSIDDALKKISTVGRTKLGKTQFGLRHQGKLVHLGLTREDAEDRVRALYEDGWFFRSKRSTGKIQIRKEALIAFFSSKGRSIRYAFGSGKRPKMNEVARRDFFDSRILVDLEFDGGIARLAPDLSQSNFSQYYGDIELARGPNKSMRAVVICYLPEECRGLSLLAEANGVEFLSPESLLVTLPSLIGESA